MTHTLAAEARTKTGHGLDSLRAAGQMPAVVYGPKHESESIAVNVREFGKVLKAAGESAVVTLNIGGKEVPTLIHEVDLDPLTHAPRHADFYAIVKGQKVSVNIPLVFTGESAAVKAGANLVKVLHEIEVEADPMSLPHELSVDIAALANVDDQILAKDISLPAGVELKTGDDEVIALAAVAVEEDLSAPVAGPDMAAIGDSVEKGKKEDEEGEAAAEPAAAQ